MLAAQLRAEPPPRMKREPRLLQLDSPDAYTPHYHHKKKGQPWRTSRRRLEGRLCGLRYRHDGAVYRTVAVE